MPRRPILPHLRKVPYSTRIPLWLRDWLAHPDRHESGAVMIELALRKMFKVKPPNLPP